MKNLFFSVFWFSYSEPWCGAMPEFAKALLGLDIHDAARWEPWTRAGHLEYRQSLVAPEVPFDVDFATVVTWLNEHLPADAIVTNGAGNYAGWVHRYFQHGPSRRQLASTSGAMGYGVPAAVAAKLTCPQRTVVSFSGDGCYMMNGQELATAVQHDLPVIFIVVNNGMYGTIRMHQESRYPGRPSATSLTNPDFAALARAYGAHGETVERTADFAPAFERAQASGKPAVIELRTDPRAVTSRFAAIDRPAA